MRPSAGDTTARGSSGTSRGGIAEELQDEEREQPERDRPPAGEDKPTPRETANADREERPAFARDHRVRPGRSHALLLLLGLATASGALLEAAVDVGGHPVERLLRRVADVASTAPACRPRAARRAPAAQFLEVSTRRFFLIQGIISRSRAPTFSIGSSAVMRRRDSSVGAPARFSSTNSLAYSPDWMR